MTTIHDYHPETGEYLQSRTAREDPKERGRYLIPANATTIAPPDAQPGHARVFDGTAWSQIADHRGETWWEDYVTSHKVENLGDPTTFDPPLQATRPASPPPTLTDVYAERERRLALPMQYDFEDARGVHTLAMTRSDMQGWQEVTNGAQALLAAGDTTTTFRIYTETGHADVTAPEWMAIVAHSITVRQPIWDAADAIEALDPIPGDYADDARWP